MEVELNSITPETINLMKLEEDKIELGKIYEEIISILKYFCDVKEEYYNLFAIWVIGAANIKNFETFPYLFINAMKGSGKTRLLKLLTRLSGGDVLNSLTEAVLFRTEGTLGIDEFEGVNRKGNENLRELLNSAYKKGIKVKRMRKVKGILGEEQKVEEFEVYRPIIMANIWGMEEVLGDRCIRVILDKSNNPLITKMLENFYSNPKIGEIWCRLCRVCSVYDLSRNINMHWNDYISCKYQTLPTLYPQQTIPTLPTLYLDFFNKVDDSKMEGRSLELTFPLLWIAYLLGEKPFLELLETFKEIEKERQEENITENLDISLIDLISQKLDNGYFTLIKALTQEFREFLQSDKEWLSPEWMGRALKRLNLIKQKRRLNRGIEVILDIKKAQEKIKMFK